MLPITKIKTEGEPTDDSGRGVENNGRSGVCFNRQTLPDASSRRLSAFSSNLVRPFIHLIRQALNTRTTTISKTKNNNHMDFWFNPITQLAG